MQQDITMKKFIEDHNGSIYIDVTHEHTIFYFDIENEENNFFVALYNFGAFFEDSIMPKHVFIQKQNAIKNGIKIVILKLWSQLAVLTCHSYSVSDIIWQVEIRTTILFLRTNWSSNQQVFCGSFNKISE